MRRRAWQGREVPLEPESWALIADGDSTPHQDAETGELLAAVRDAIEDDLTPHQREVFVAATLNEVPIDVLAERLNATRGALYKTIHDARGKLRAALAARELGVGDRTATATTRPHGAPRRASQATVAERARARQHDRARLDAVAGEELVLRGRRLATQNGKPAWPTRSSN